MLTPATLVQTGTSYIGDIAGGGNQFLLMAGQLEKRAIAELTFLNARRDHRHVGTSCGGDGAVDLSAPDVSDTGVPHELHARIAAALEVLESDVVGGVGAEREVRNV